VNVIVAVPSPTAVIVNVPEPVTLLLCARALRFDESAGAEPAATVATAVFDELAVNVPV
jgi:hypothetical protein